MNTFKHSLFLIAFVASTLFVNAQKYGVTAKDSIKCLESLSLYKEDYKQKNYKSAVVFWRDAITVCPKSTKNLYLHGVNMYRKFIKETSDEIKRNELIDSLMWIYDKRIEHFGQEPFVRGRKGSDLLRYRKDQPELAYNELKKSVDMAKENSECGVIYAYYNSAFKVAQKKIISKEELIELYLPLSEYINKKVNAVNKAEKKDQKKIERCAKAKNNLDEMFIKIAKCEDIEPIMVKRFSPDADVETLKKGLSLMDKRDCKELEIYGKYAEKLHELEPSAASAYALGAKAFAKGELAKAGEYFDQAIKLCGDCENIGTYTFAAAQLALKRGQTGKAKTLARKAMGADASLASKCYLVIAGATARSASSCGSDPISRKSCYWLAYDYAKKAGSAQAMSSYKANFPSKTELFDYGMLDKVGSSYTVPCLGESTTIRMK